MQATMNDPSQALRSLQPKHHFLVGIDSDGCAFDTMEVKHKECFIPNTINEWELQAVSKYAREAAEFVNLYSKWRGINRFPALLMTFDLLAERPEVQKRGVQIPPVPNLRQWVTTETKLANPALEAAAKATGHCDLVQALRWSMAVNASIEKFVRGVPPFPFVRDSLEQLAAVADIIVVSATPGEALKREWEEHHIARYAAVIAGQEMGTKKEHLEIMAKGKYPPGRTLMIGDAPGDLKAARANGFLFFPVNPGHEEECWQRLLEEGLDHFFNGSFAGPYEQKLVAEFEELLPDTPPWKHAS